jgi:transcription initiation factor TFIIH subunit 1
MTEQRLADLGGDPEEERIILNIQDQRKFFSNDNEDMKTQNKFTDMDATSVLGALSQDLGTKPFGIADLLPGEEDEEMDEQGFTSTGKTSFHLATKQVTEAVRDRSSQLLAPSMGTNGALATGGLPREVFDSVQSVHATTNEFLRHFWLAFLSGDEKRAKDINSMVTSLRNSKERIEAVAKNAEEQREELKAQRKKDLHEEYKKTGIKPKKKDMEVGGGKKVVDDMLGPTLVAIERALAKYQAALDETEKLAGGSTAAATPVSIAS